MMRWMRLPMVGCCVLSLSSTAQAQSAEERPIDLLPDAYRTSVEVLFSNIANKNLFEVGEFSGFGAAGVLVSAFVHDLASFPLGTSSGGFIYTTEAGNLGLEPVRTNESFGPAFAERAQTIGRDRSSFGVTFLHRKYDALEGQKIGTGELRVGTPLFNIFGQAIDVVRSDFAVKIDSFTTTLFGTYGVTDQWDVAIAVPFQQVDMDTAVTTTLEVFGDRITAGRAAGAVSVAGLGDIAVRSKVKLFETGRGTPNATQGPSVGSAVAAGFDLRVPTGDETSLLGTGLNRLKVYGAGSFKLGRRLLPHVNVAYTFPSGSEDSEGSEFFFSSELGLAAGAEGVLSERLTVVGDVVGRRLSHEGRMRESASTVQSLLGYRLLGFAPGVPLEVWLGTVGFKFNPRSTFIVSGHLLFPLNDQGLQSRMSAVIGADYTFGTGRIQGPRAARR